MSGGNNNITVAIPGRANWDVWWFNGLENFQLDIVGFLAVLGESSILANAQVSALSRLFYLPRLLPAPQALLRTSRPTTLPPVLAKVSGVHSGNVKDHIHHVAHVLLGHDLSTFEVRLVEVTKVYRTSPPTRIDTLFRGQPTRSKTLSPQMGPPLIKAKATGPLSWVTLLGFMISVTLFIASITFGDGMSILATILLSGLSTIIGISNKWSLRLPQRPKGQTVRGDVVIRYPNGSYLIVRCEEDIARELYFAPEEIIYELKSQTLYRLLSLLGTMMLMLSVIALANSKLYLQVAWAVAYVIINAAHWIVAALPQKLHWDLTCYNVQEQSIAGGPKNPNFTEALWKTILITKTISWVKGNEAAPNTEVWNAWLSEAEQKANEYGSHVGTLVDPIWPGDDSDKGIVWDVPDPQVWRAKEAWDNLNREYMAAEAADTVHPNKAV